MPIAAAELMGFVPSLEVLPFFIKPTEPPSFQLRAHSSYGEIARSMLTRRLVGGIIPWEIFVSDVLALPGQRTAWKVLLFLHACPTELVLREAIYKAIYPADSSSKSKLPRKLTVGIESQHSLTIAQAQQWLRQWKGNSTLDLSFKMLPMDLMPQAIEAEAIDALIAPSPWGLKMENAGIGKRDTHFSPGKFGQQVVIACHRTFLENHPDLASSLPQSISTSRNSLQDPTLLHDAANAMSRAGKPLLDPTLLAQSAATHLILTSAHDILPGTQKLLTELAVLEKFSLLPAQVSANEQTAHLLEPG